ncbi:uncharacterized protein LACBIDRAFT_318871 [Laccaria bicolor S238N-H82]|uniref:Predicted protein n=1 Tax=Laccaria bicolor (strain S238N-H82 / ATCC MYA-4686) TaxID=486041 RepID=B0D7B3_LACBS|nr:uncharacterized protein LACBIDRAFT_318871 [Laccaria bicolor S238N-H82]EDR09365.1 predicted protein [Laccaria bicolor S238N-H82]|eukprot:XP_001879714.1 predicted protein [Laccaria bicolor S238N-H82]
MSVAHYESFYEAALWAGMALCSLFLAIILYKTTQTFSGTDTLLPFSAPTLTFSVPLFMASMYLFTGCINAGTVYIRLSQSTGLYERLMKWEGNQMDWLVVFLSVVLGLAAGFNFASARNMVRLHWEMKSLAGGEGKRGKKDVEGV